jgi:hypothetical protein
LERFKAMKVWVITIASGAKQSIAVLAFRWIASLRSQ